MAKFSGVVLVISIFTLCSLLRSDFVKAATEVQCTYPKGSVACKMFNDTKMDCSWRELVCTPPLHRKPLLELLDLSRNKLTQLPKDSFSGLSGLLTLDLSLNDISTVTSGAFSGLNKLQKLDLSFNNISAMTNGAFNGITSLRVLDLSLNKIPTLHEGVFRKLRKLDTLDLSSNIISIIHENVFCELNLLQMLDMSNNSIPSLSDNVWNGIHNLLHLNLRRLSVHRFSVSNGTFRGLNKLNSLDLSLTNLRFLTDTPFRNLTSLRSLHLPETHITPAMFDGLNNSLQFLRVTANDFGTDTPFVHLSSLKHLELELDLNTCNYNENLLKGLAELNYLKLTGGLYILKCPSDIDFSPLVSLTYLEWDDWISFLSHGPIQTLNSLNSPLKTLIWDISSYYRWTTVDSSTFKLLPKWRESLQELHVYIHSNIQINGSPFTWFPELRVLRVRCHPDLVTIWTHPKDTFKNLTNLEEVHLNHLNINDSVVYDLLGTFGMYNSVKVLDLSYNIIVLNEYMLNPYMNPICNLTIL